MANLSNPKDRPRGQGSGIQGPEDRYFAKLRTKSRAVRDGREKFTNDEINRIIAQLLLER